MSIQDQFKLSPTVQEYIKNLGFSEYTEIQKKVIPLALKKNDIIGVSDTGTGKTHAFLIPIFDMIDPSKQCVQAVVTAPTRELARQIYERALEYNSVDSAVRIRLITGEIEKTKMIEQLKLQPQLVIGTPGRLKDAFIKSEVLRLDTADCLVVDEADMTLEFGFLDEVDSIAGNMKKDLQMMVFSATIPQSLQPFLKKYLHNPTQIRIKNDELMKPRISHLLIPCKHLGYVNKLLEILPSFDPFACLIFANSKQTAKDCANTLREKGYDVTELHGDLTTRQRKSSLKTLTSLAAKYIVATDIAARGMDITGISHVVSLGFPSSLEYYIHRAGRTGRAGSTGICYALYNSKDEISINQLIKQGVEFQHVDYKGNKWQDLKPFGRKYVKKTDAVEKEIAKSLRRKNEKVKPGYKKKRNAEIEKIKRKHKRSLIQASIANQKKERNKLKQREKETLYEE